MKNYLLYFFAILIWTISLPFVFIVVPDSLLPDKIEYSEEETLSKEETKNITVSVYETSSGNILNIPLEDYTAGVLSAEMPEAAHSEAMKTAATAARTYALYHLEQGDKRSGHTEADLCDNPAHCRAFTLDTSEAAVIAAESTAGEAIYYKKSYINPIFHIASAVRTESSENAFGVAVPYLLSVETPDNSNINDFFQQKEFSKSEFYNVMINLGIELDPESDHKSWLGHCTYTEGGRIHRLAVNGGFVTGVQLMKEFGLQSANISIKEGSAGFIFETEGIGHGAGLSQYGACLLAEDGMGYIEILKHYYTGVYII